MSNTFRYRRDYSTLSQFADQVISLELIWPFPLIGIGVLRIHAPVLTSLAVILALLPWFARWLVFGKLTNRTFISGALILFVMGGLVGIWASYDPALSWPLFLTLLGSVSLFFVIANTPVSLLKVASGLVVAATILAFYFVSQYGYFYYPTEAGRLASLGRMTGSLLPNFVFFTPHPNAAAGFLESVLLLSWVLVWRARGRERLVWGVATLIIIYGLLISGSRGAWLGLVVALAIWALLLIPNQGLRLAIGGVGFVGAAVGTYLLLWQAPPGLQIPGLASALATAGHRLALYRNSLYLWGDYPFTGIGLGDTFAMIYSRYQLLIPVPFLTYSHNLFLSAGLGLGVLGLAALIWLLAGFYYFVICVEKVGLEAQLLPLFRAAWLGVTATFVHGLTDAPQFAGSGWTMPMLFAVLGLAVALGRPALIESEQEEVEAMLGIYHRWGWLAPAAVVVIFVVVAAIFWRSFMSAWYANLGAIQQTRAELSPGLADSAREAETTQAVNNFARALSLAPSQVVANRRLGFIALNRENYDTAVVYLEQAYRQEPRNQATLKALGYAYMWTGQLGPAVELLQQLDDQGELLEELGNWSWWWGTQNREDLSTYTDEMVQLLSTQQ